ncbi:MAG: radical SAM protein [Desulfurococcales archaeon]|nr:radical SAM protein [Desulfurococcales archaeon]
MDEAVFGDPKKALLSRPWLPTGCSYCFTGSKAVIFVTGLCDDGCYYCPVSRDKLGSDVFFVNEEKLNLDELEIEIERSNAVGASLTGGDPLVIPERTIELTKRLKSSFGSSFHIHLYTSGRYATREVLWDLYSSGLDEIRFHPTRDIFLNRINWAAEIKDWSVGVEIPISTNLESWAKDVIKYAEKAGAGFVNLNEMEVSPSNIHKLKAMGLKPSIRKPVVESAFETGMKIVEWARRQALKINVHFCPATYKDFIQTRNRFRRTGFVDAKPYEEVTVEGTLRYGVLRNCRDLVMKYDIEYINEEYRLPPIEEWVRNIAREHHCEGFIEEAHPTRNREPVIESARIYP